MLGVLKRHWRPKRGNSRRKSKDKTTPVSESASGSNASNNNDGITVVESGGSASLLVPGSTATTTSSGQSTQSPPSRDNQASSPRETSTSKISRLRVTKSPLRDHRDNSGQPVNQVNQVTILVKPKTVPDKNRSVDASPLKKNKKIIPVPRVKSRSKDKDTPDHSPIHGGTSTRNNSIPNGRQSTWTKDASVLSPLSDDGGLPKMESEIVPEETWNDHKTEDSKKDLSDKEVTTLLSKESSWSSDDNTIVSRDIAEHTDLIFIRDEDSDKVLEELSNGQEVQSDQGHLEDDDEKSDPVKEHLEFQVEELRAQLELQSALLRREQEQLSRMHLQSQVREGLRQELEREKMMRVEAEVRLREVRLENECCKARLATLQEDFRKMEEMVRDMIQFKTRIDQLKHEKSSLALTYESKMRKYQTYIASLEKENFMLLNELKSVEISKTERQEEQDRSLSRVLLERVRLLEQENATLSLENEQQRLQYEHCLDDVANQVVQALLAQKNLREECGKLQLRVQELEQQNRSLSHVFKTHFIQPIAGRGSAVDLWPSRLRADNSEIVIPFNSSQQELRLEMRPEARDSPNTSQSEDSAESLASLCSDYSLHSSGSGVYHNSQDHQKMSSPPKWLLDQSSISRPSAVAVLAASSSLGVSDQSQKCTIWAELLRKAEINCLSQSNEGQKVSLDSQRDVDEAAKEDWKQAFLRERGNSRRRWSVLRASSEIGDLDSMDTPSDETAPFDGFSLATSRFRLSFPALVSTNHHSTDLIDNNRASIIFPPPPAPSSSVYENSDPNASSILLSPPTRPTTLNIVPHIMGDPSSNFANYQSLERKSHIVNKSGNMYEELDLPAFPRDSSENDRSYSNESPDNRLLRTNSREYLNCPDRELTNTVVRKTSSFNNQMTSSGDTVIVNDSLVLKNPSNVSSPTLPPPCVLDEPTILNQKRASDSPLSTGVSEHGKDEGYSTMSSDVQCESNEPTIIPNTQLNSLLPSSSPISKSLPRETRIIVVNQPISVNDYREGVMASSSDSGLSLQRFSRLNSSITRDTVEEESSPSSGFERELDNSLIRRCAKVEEAKNDENGSSAPEENLGQLDSGLGDSPQAHRVSSFSEPNDFGLPRDDEDNEKKEKSLHRSSLDPSYDKILTLLTPRGFRPPCSASPHLRSVACNSDCKIETAEKATFTEPEAYFQTEFASEGSLYSLECGNTSKSCPDNNSRDGDCESSSSFIRFDQNPSHSPLPTASSIPTSKTFPWYDASDIYAVACRYCRSRGTKHGLEFSTRVEALGSLLRAFSDSHLVIKKTFDQPMAMRSDSLGTRCPPLRLNLLPLERHSSAVDLSPVSEPILREPIAKKDDRGQMMKSMKPTHWLACLPSEHQPSPSLSLSTVHSSSSGEVASVEDDEDLGATSLKCSRERDISSESDNDLLEHNHLVEQWLQKGSAEISQKLGFTYDEEEIGNWSFQLSAEDLSQGQVTQWDRDRWMRLNYDNPSSSERSSTQKLEKIRENTEYEFQDDFWNAPPFWSKNKDSATENADSSQMSRSETASSSATFIRAPKVSPIEEKCEPIVPNTEELDPVDVQTVPDVEEIRSQTEVDKDTMGKGQSTLESACRCGEDGHNLCAACEEGLQAEVCEFNRDFYRLCSTDSTRSLAASSKSLSECGCLEHAHLKQRLLLNESAKIEESASSMESKRKPISSATFRKKRTSDTLPKVDLPVVEDEDVEKPIRTKDSSQSNEDRKISGESSRTSGIPTINKLPSEKRKSDKTRIPVSTKMATKIPKEQSQASTPSISSKHSRHHRSSSANNEERSKRHAERNRLQRSYSEENRSVDKTNSQSSPKHTTKESSRSGSSKTTPQNPRPSNARRKSPSSRVGEKKIPKPISRKTSIDIEKNQETMVAKDEVREASQMKMEKEISKRSMSKSRSLETKQSVKDKEESIVRESSIEKNNEVKKREKNSSKKRRSKEGCGTSWVHFETDVDLSDPKARANLLDSMMASSSSSSGGTDTDEDVQSIAPSLIIEKIEEEEEIVEPVKEEKVIEHTKHEKLHALHKFRRQKKKVSDPDAVISIFPRLRASIIDRHDFYYRFGEKEQEAVACFDFLDELSTSPSDVDSCDLEASQKGACASGICERIRQESYRAMEGRDNYLEALDLGGNVLNSSDKYSNRLSLDESKFFSRRSSPHDSFSSTTLNSQDFGDHISLSDSCAESYNSSTNSLNRIM